MTIRIIDQLLSYNDHLEKRDVASLDTIVLHCTELPSLAMAREYGEKILYPESQTGNSGHFYVDRDGLIYRYAEENRMARHVIGQNLKTLGIEIVNTGRYPKWFYSNHQEFHESYSTEQLDSVRTLLADLKRRIPNIGKIARHSDLDTTWVPSEDKPEIQVRRRLDPGPLFPWDEFLQFWAAL